MPSLDKSIQLQSASSRAVLLRLKSCTQPRGILESAKIGFPDAGTPPGKCIPKDIRVLSRSTITALSGVPRRIAAAVFPRVFSAPRGPLSFFLLVLVTVGEHRTTRATTCQIMRAESEKFKKYSKFNYPRRDPRSFEIVRAANGWLKNSRSTNLRAAARRASGGVAFASLKKGERREKRFRLLFLSFAAVRTS